VTVLAAAVVTPLSGPLARFGQATAAALRLWARSAPDLPSPWHAVSLDAYDAHPEPAVAIREAIAAHPGIVFGPYGSSPTLAVIGATRRPVWNHGGASSVLRRPQFPHTINVLSPASTYFGGALEVVKAVDPSARTVALLHGSTGFARDVGGGAAAAGLALGFEVRTSVFEPGAAAAAAGVLTDADVVLVAGSFEDEVAAVGALVSRPWRAIATVGAGVDEVLASLGHRREGLLGPAQWVPSVAAPPDEGPDAAWFVLSYRRATGTDPAYPAAQAFAAGVLAARCLRDAGEVDDDALLAAACQLRCRTLYGDFRLHPETGLQVGHRVLTVQWQDGRRRVVWPADAAERPLAYPRPSHLEPHPGT
jgi:branched-chain amino acid transport system substrate-binding protein